MTNTHTQAPRRGRPPMQRPAPNVEKNVFADPVMVAEPIARDIPRPDVREEDPRTRAAKRAAELRDHLGDMDDGQDEFYFDPSCIPPGWSYEWKTKTVHGAENPAYMLALMRKGWENVPASRHPEMMPEGNFKTIERKGQILMERPLEITEEARNIDLKRARDQIRAKEAQLNSAPDGQFERDSDARTRARVKHSYEPIAIPQE